MWTDLEIDFCQYNVAKVVILIWSWATNMITNFDFLSLVMSDSKKPKLCEQNTQNGTKLHKGNQVQGQGEFSADNQH
jgi:hypothetical protein